MSFYKYNNYSLMFLAEIRNILFSALLQFILRIQKITNLLFNLGYKYFFLRLKMVIFVIDLKS